MKQYLISIIFLVICSATYAQSPQSFQYQSVIRDVSGAALVNQPVNFQLSIITGTLPGTVEYVETHSSTTNDFGIATLAIGSGTPVTNLFSDIDWSVSPHFLKVEADLGSGYIDMGTTQLLSVPYALYSEQAGNIPVYSAGNGIDVTGTTITNTAPDQNVTLTQGGATTITGTYPDFTISSTDLNTGTPGGLNKTIQYNNAGAFDGDTALVWDNTNKRFGVGIANPLGRVVIKGSPTALASEPLFEIKNKNGQQIMVVYEDSVHFFITDVASNQGGFAVSGRSNAKAVTNDFLRINPDSTRIWTGDTITGFGVKNIGTTSKTSYLQLTPNNYFIGHEAGKSITSGLYNSFIGYQSGLNNTIGSKNYFIGYKAGFSNTVGLSNIFIGDSAGYFNTEGLYNIFSGNQCGFSNTLGSANVASGFRALYSNNEGSYNVATGFVALFHNISGYANTANGMQSLYSNTTGYQNTANGCLSLFESV